VVTPGAEADHTVLKEDPGLAPMAARGSVLIPQDARTPQNALPQDLPAGVSLALVQDHAQDPKSRAAAVC